MKEEKEVDGRKKEKEREGRRMEQSEGRKGGKFKGKRDKLK